jgi:hypothetical protein
MILKRKRRRRKVTTIISLDLAGLVASIDAAALGP